MKGEIMADIKIETNPAVPFAGEAATLMIVDDLNVVHDLTIPVDPATGRSALEVFSEAIQVNYELMREAILSTGIPADVFRGDK